ncbi:MAG: penicillin acylase family protein, partial [Deltaproteobacteria bacterium]|nr:penicillin acylase family protein [Deltaproteobacteria bacterium]
MEVSRTTGGVAEIWAPDDLGLAKGLGFMHAHDRMVQLMLSRLAGQGRLAECLKSNSETETI